MRVIVLSAGGRALALRVDTVREVLRVPAITMVPGAPAAVAGLINLRGRVVPVLALALVLGLPAAASTAQARILVVDHASGPVGLLCDGVTDLVRLGDDATCEAPPELVPPRGGVRSAVRHGDRWLLLVEVPCLVPDGEEA